MHSRVPWISGPQCTVKLRVYLLLPQQLPGSIIFHIRDGIPLWIFSLEFRYSYEGEQVVSIWLESIILGTILNYMVDKDPVAEAHKKEMEELRQFIEVKNLPPDLSIRLCKHFEFQYQKAVENRASSSVRLPRFPLSYRFEVRECILIAWPSFADPCS